jgi:hypothetical protein
MANKEYYRKLKYHFHNNRCADNLNGAAIFKAQGWPTTPTGLPSSFPRVGRTAANPGK